MADRFDVQIVELCECPHVAGLLARWHVAEWGHLYPAWDVSAALAEFAAMERAGAVPTTWVAFAGAARTDDAVLGSISLIADDELDGYRDDGPWLASLYVAEPARNTAVGGRLVAHLVTAARTLGLPRLLLFTSGQEAYYERLGWRPIDRVDAQGHPATVMVLDLRERAALRSVVSTWTSDRFVGGAYSFLRVGGTPADRAVLAEPVAPGLLLAGEATSVAHPGTAHGAWESGAAAARRLLDRPEPPRAVVVVGAGMAGISAGRRLREHGCDVVVLEAAGEIGGRTRVDRTLGGPLPLGAMWAHGADGNPYLELARAVGVVEVEGVVTRPATFLVGRGALTAADQRRLSEEYVRMEATLASDPADPDDAVGPALRRALADIDDDRDRNVLACWFRGEFENLYAAPVDELSRHFPAEPFRLPGPDVMLVGDLGAAVARAADGLDIRLDHAVTAVRRGSGAWFVDVEGGPSLTADAVVVTTAVPALQQGAVRFEPAWPDRHLEALARIGAGPVAKCFFTFATAWWGRHRSFWVVGADPLPFELWVDVSAFLGRPALCAFAVGEHARTVEAMDEDARCRLATELVSGIGPLA